MNPSVGHTDHRDPGERHIRRRLCAPMIVVIAVALVGLAGPAAAQTPRIHHPGAPTGVTATALDGGVSVAWTAPASDGGSSITGYSVAASHDGGMCTTTVATTCTVTGLNNDDSYALRVRASNIAGSGPAATVRVSLLPAVSFVSDTSFTYPAEQAIVTLSRSTSSTVRVDFYDLRCSRGTAAMGGVERRSGGVPPGVGHCHIRARSDNRNHSVHGRSYVRHRLFGPLHGTRDSLRYPAVLVTLVHPRHAQLGSTPASSLFYGP